MALLGGFTDNQLVSMSSLSFQWRACKRLFVVLCEPNVF
jgi:hypothetical protein